MPRFGQHRSSASLALLLIFASLAFAWLQYVDSPRVASAAANSASDASLAFAALRPQVTPAASSVTGAAPAGRFEPLVTPTAVPTATSAPTLAPAPEPTAAVTPTHLLDSGIASTYGSGDGFEGRRTACGAIFHTGIVQVAHKTLPCGTLLRIEDTSTGRTVDAEVTDRGPYVPGRIVDLSWAAFSQLDPAGPGLLRVNIYLLDS
jgi:rare lipoprotein A